MKRHYQRNPEVTERAIDDAVFLAGPDTEEIFQLNPMGTVLWRLLADPIGVEEVVEVLHRAFPDIARKRIETDVSALIAALVDRGLVTDKYQASAS